MEYVIGGALVLVVLFVMTRDLRVSVGEVAVLLPIAVILVLVAGFAIAAVLLLGPRLPQ